MTTSKAGLYCKTLNTDSMNIYAFLHCEDKKDVAVIIRIRRVTHLRLVLARSPMKSLNMTVEVIFITFMKQELFRCKKINNAGWMP